MTTLENTISMMKTLPEADLVKIQELATKLFRHHCESELTDEAADEAVGRFLKPRSREGIIQDLAVSRKQATEGKCTEMGQAIAGIREKYGI